MEERKDNIFNNLEELLSKETIVDENGVVSAYTVYKTLERYFENVFFNAYDNYNLVSKINNSYTNKEIRDSRRRGFNSPYLKVLDIRSNVYNLDRNRDEVLVTFIPFGPENRGYQPRSNVLYREGKDKVPCIKYKECFDFCDNLWEKYYEDISSIFELCEKHSKLKWFFTNGNSEYALCISLSSSLLIFSFPTFLKR